MNTSPTITGVVLTNDGERLLASCLQSLSFCNALLVVDASGTDAAGKIAEEYGAEILRSKSPERADRLKAALEHVGTDWVVLLEQDEICSDPLREQIFLSIDKASPKICAFSVRRRTWYYDRFLKHGDLSPERLLRVFRTGGVSLDDGTPKPVGKTRRLKGALFRYPFDSFHDQVAHGNDAAEQDADVLRGQGLADGAFSSFAKALGRFLKAYVLKLGFLDGRAGFALACHDAFMVFSTCLRIGLPSWSEAYNDKGRAVA